MDLPKLQNLDVKQKKVLVRMDLDISPEEVFRLEKALPTLEYLRDQASKIIIIGHKGRPDGKKVSELSLEPVSKALEELLTEKWGNKAMDTLNMNMMENLRFDQGEEANNADFAKHLAAFGEVYVNEAFASSHRQHASIVSLPKLLPHAAGIRFAQEVENLSKILDGPNRPVVLILSGVKKDKLNFLNSFKNFADKILVAGRLPEYLDEDYKDNKVTVARLLPDKEDITIHSIEAFEREISKAGTIIVGGPVGKFEDEGHRQGTKRVFEAVANSNAFKIAGGGETEKAIEMLNLQDKFDWISVGGGAMLEFLAKRTLPGIEALLN